MARPRKTGLDYFSLDVDFDEKVEALELEFGNDGFAFFVKTLQSCYKTEDGEFDCSEVFRRKMAAKRANLSEKRWEQIAEYAVSIRLFDPEVWETRKVLTSTGIKKRIDAVSAERKAGRLRKEAARSPSPTPPTCTKRKKRERERESKGNPPLSDEPRELSGGKPQDNFSSLSPLWPGCNFFRCSEADMANVEDWYAKNQYPLRGRDHILEAAENWMADGATPRAREARKLDTHHRRLMNRKWVQEALETLGTAAPTLTPHQARNRAVFEKEFQRAKQENASNGNTTSIRAIDEPRPSDRAPADDDEGLALVFGARL